ncbi:MAG: ABC transporter permease [Nitrospinota bacterium]
MDTDAGGRSPWRALWRHPSGRLGAALLLTLSLTSLGAPWLAPADPLATNLGARLLPPAWMGGGELRRPLGTDELGRDLLSRLLYGGRLSLSSALAAMALALLTGGLIGALAGFLGGVGDALLMRLMDLLLAFPAILLAVAVVGALGPGLLHALLAIAVVNVPHYARLLRASLMEEMAREHVAASRALGSGPLRVLFRSALPGALPPLVVQASMGAATVVLEAAGLSFLGLGAQPPAPEWGAMLAEGRSLILRAPWAAVAPGVAILLASAGFHLVGDALRDLLDPRWRAV